MESNILDLRQQRCPMALLLAKRRTNALFSDEKLQILIADSSSLSDISRYLQQQKFELCCEDGDGYYRLQVCRLYQ